LDNAENLQKAHDADDDEMGRLDLSIMVLLFHHYAPSCFKKKRRI
jgi:hypothetical protein